MLTGSSAEDGHRPGIERVFGKTTSAAMLWSSMCSSRLSPVELLFEVASDDMTASGRTVTPYPTTVNGQASAPGQHGESTVRGWGQPASRPPGTANGSAPTSSQKRAQVAKASGSWAW